MRASESRSPGLATVGEASPRMASWLKHPVPGPERGAGENVDFSARCHILLNTGPERLASSSPGVVLPRGPQPEPSHQDTAMWDPG